MDTLGLAELERDTVGEVLREANELELGVEVGKMDSEADAEGQCDPEGVPDSDTDTLAEALTD